MSFRRIYGNDWSENGWRMCNRDECYIITLPNLAYMDTAPVRKGPAGLVLGAWAYWYDRNVPGEIVSPTWGWSATNDVSTSNHLSGTALDINATQYPWGGNVMQRKYPNRVAAIREGLRLFEGLLFWGAEWSRKDEMHFQMNAGTAVGTEAAPRVKAFCDKYIDKGIYVGKGGGIATPEYSQSVKDAFAQVGSRFGWV